MWLAVQAVVAEEEAARQAALHGKKAKDKAAPPMKAAAKPADAEKQKKAKKGPEGKDGAKKGKKKTKDPLVRPAPCSLH